MSELPLLSLVIPCFNEEENIYYLEERLNAIIEALATRVQVEVWLVDDHSTDATPDRLKIVCQRNPNYHYLRLAANSGSHVALIAGMQQIKGNVVSFLAADLQDPPELLPKMLDLWAQGNHVVWAIRAEREGISAREKFFSNLFYNLLNRFSSVKLPPSGADYSMLDRRVVNALLQSVGANPSLALEIARLGFKQAQLPYVKEARKFGVSKWNIRKKLNAFADAFVSTSYMPLRLMSYVGLLASALGFLYALFVIVLRFVVSTPIEGWSTNIVVILVFGGIQMIMLGVIGEYLWRTLEHARKRPLYFIEDSSEEDIKLK
jgi:polyisoprenyl-phosphate glycosyltransferase